MRRTDCNQILVYGQDDGDGGTMVPSGWPGLDGAKVVSSTGHRRPTVGGLVMLTAPLRRFLKQATSASPSLGHRSALHSVTRL
jgi:hypothetical protein